MSDVRFDSREGYDADQIAAMEAMADLTDAEMAELFSETR